MEINLPIKRYYKIGEVAKAFNVNVSLIRYWEGEFKNIKPKKNAKGDRMFTATDIESFKLIFHLVKEKGLTLEGAKQHLKAKPKEVIDKHLVISKLENIKAELLKIKNQL